MESNQKGISKIVRCANGTTLVWVKGILMLVEKDGETIESKIDDGVFGFSGEVDADGTKITFQYGLVTAIN